MTAPVYTTGHFEMATNDAIQDRRGRVGGVPRDPGGMLRWFVRNPFRKEPWLAAAYLFVEFPIGIAAFAYAVAMISVGVGTIILAFLGAALLALFMYSLQPYGELQRQLSNNLLGTRIGPLPFHGETGPLWGWTRLRMRFGNPMTWRVLVYLFVRFPLSIAGFILATMLIATPIAFLAAPIVGAAGGQTLWADSWHEGLPLAFLAPITFVVAANLLWGAGWLSGLIARLFLGTRFTGVPEDGPSVAERARAAMGAWNNPGAPVILDSGIATELARESPGEAATATEPVPAQAEPEEGLMVDVAMRRVRVNGRPVELTPKEFDLLALFAQNPGRPFSRDDLLDRIWRNDYEVTDRTIDTHVQRLRKKLGNQSSVIQTVWGVGYRFAEGEPAAAEDQPEEPDDSDADGEPGQGW